MERREEEEEEEEKRRKPPTTTPRSPKNPRGVLLVVLGGKQRELCPSHGSESSRAGPPTEKTGLWWEAVAEGTPRGGDPENLQEEQRQTERVGRGASGQLE